MPERLQSIALDCGQLTIWPETTAVAIAQQQSSDPPQRDDPYATLRSRARRRSRRRFTVRSGRHAEMTAPGVTEPRVSGPGYPGNGGRARDVHAHGARSPSAQEQSLTSPFASAAS